MGTLQCAHLIHGMTQRARFLMLMLVFFLNEHAVSQEQLAEQDKPVSKVMACNASNPRNMSLVCECSINKIKCRRLVFPLTAVPTNMLTKVEILDLSSNHIQQIESDDFTGMEFLTNLELQDNIIKFIDPYAFKNMYRLQNLNLAENHLTILDPSGLTFQHLSSLNTLSLQSNSIIRMNMYSFFTMTASQNISIDLEYNRVRCDCEIWGIKSWQSFLSEDIIKINNLKCENDEQKRPYNEVDDEVFGRCNSKEDDVFRQPIQCPSCSKQRTNHGCNKQNMDQCSGDQTVCLRTVQWSASDKLMQISSRCSTYQLCLSEEVNNKKTCAIDPRTKQNVACDFCCRGPTCAHDTLGGRTKDFTLEMSYVRNATFQKYMEDSAHPLYLDEETRIDSGIRSSIQNLKGGVDVYITNFVQQDNQHYKVVLRLEVTVFSIETRDSVVQILKNDMKHGFENSFLHKENIIIGTLDITPFKRVKEQCEKTISLIEGQGLLLWNMTDEGTVQFAPCNYQHSLKKKKSFAFRQCIRNKQNDSVEWGEVNAADCAFKENFDEDALFNTTLTPDNAQTMSAWLDSYIQSDNFSVDCTDKVVDLLEKMNDEKFLQQPDVVSNILKSVSSLISNEQKTNMGPMLTPGAAKRILAVVESIAEKGPLTEGKLIVMTPNLVIAAQEINATETRPLMFTAEKDVSNGLNDSVINIGFSNGNVSQPADGMSILIPTEVLFASLTPNEKNNVSRVTFVMHQSDRLFAAMEGDKNKDIQQTNELQNPYCEANYIHSCPKEKSYKTNSQVISASIPGIRVHDLKENITTNFIHIDINATNHRCVFWDDHMSNGTGGWSDEGCGVVKSYSGGTVCGCNHLTNFALLMDVYQAGISLSDLDRKVLSIISYVGCGISVFALLLTLLTYTCFRKLRRDNPSKILINLCLALTFSNLIFLVGMQDYTFGNTASCKAVAVLLHYFLLSSLMWMAVEAFYMYLALVIVFKTYFANFILKCSLVGWGIPVLIVVITLGVNVTDNYGFINSGLCWLKNPAFYAAFVGPVCFILLINCIAFGLVIKQLVNISSTKLHKFDRNSTVQRLRGAIGVVVLLGLTWLFAIFAIGQASVAFYYLFAVFNSLQGLFIFLFYCLLKKDTRQSWKRLLPCFDEYGESTKSSSNSRAMTATSAGHHLVKHSANSGSSTLQGTTLTTGSTLVDSKNDSYCRNKKYNNETSEDCDAQITSVKAADSATN